jgi:hypothetical protein
VVSRTAFRRGPIIGAVINDPGGPQPLGAQHNPAPVHPLTPDGRFFHDGSAWHATPLPPDTLDAQRRGFQPLIWLLVVVLGVAGGFVTFQVLVAVGLLAVHPG